MRSGCESLNRQLIPNTRHSPNILQYFATENNLTILGCLSCQNGFNILLAIFPLERTVCTGYFLFCVQIFTFTTCKGERWTYCPKPNTTRTQVQSTEDKTSLYRILAIYPQNPQNPLRIFLLAMLEVAEKNQQHSTQHWR